MSNDKSGNNTSHSHQVRGITREDETADSHSTRESGQQDTVEITEMASQLKSLEQKLAKQPDVDQDHVNRVRDAIHRGEYRVDPDRVATKMMGFEEDS